MKKLGTIIVSSIVTLGTMILVPIMTMAHMIIIMPSTYNTIKKSLGEGNHLPKVTIEIESVNEQSETYTG